MSVEVKVDYSEFNFKNLIIQEMNRNGGFISNTEMDHGILLRIVSDMKKDYSGLSEEIDYARRVLESKYNFRMVF